MHRIFGNRATYIGKKLLVWLNSARCIVLFQDFVVLWKIHMSRNIILSADVSC
jgi:hypothetical protein